MRATSRSVAVLALLLACVLAGCDLSGVKKVNATGTVGDTFKGPGGLRVTLVRYLPKVPPHRDVTGLGNPKEGTHFAAFLVKLCINTSGLPTISERNFTVPLVGGGEAEAKFPQTVYSDGLDLLGTAGCEEGHVVFQVPTGKKPASLKFNLDVNKGSVNGYSDRTKIRFMWKL